MTSSRIHRRALAALGAVVVVAGVSVPTALAAMGSGADTAIGSPTITAVAAAPTPAVEDAVADAELDASDSSSVAIAIPDIGVSLADAIIERLRLPTGPVLVAPPVAAERAVTEPVAPASPAVSAAPVAESAPVAVAAPAAAPSAPAEPERDRPSRDRNPVRGNGPDDRIEVEVYGAAIPEPPEVASSTTTETVLVEPDPSDPWRAVRECESSGNYRVNTGNGFYGAYQFTIRTWNWVAGIIGRGDLIGVRPDLASPADQDRMAHALAFEVRGGGLGHWPVCGRLYGS